MDWECAAVRWAAGFWKLQGLTRRRLGMPKLFMTRATAPMFSGRDGSTRTTQRWAWEFGIGLRVLVWLGMVGAGRFELPTSWSRSTRAARLRYAPIGYGKGKDALREGELQRRFLRR